MLNLLKTGLACIKQLLQSILDAITDGNNAPQIEGLDLIRWCDPNDDTQAPTGWSAFVLDEETGLPAAIFFDPVFNVIAAQPAGEPCEQVIGTPPYVCKDEVCADVAPDQTDVTVLRLVSLNPISHTVVAGPSYLDPVTLAAIPAADVTVKPCDCACGCGGAVACVRIREFDYEELAGLDNEAVWPLQFDVTKVLDGTIMTGSVSIARDAGWNATTPKTAFYAGLVALINGLPGGGYSLADSPNAAPDNGDLDLSIETGCDSSLTIRRRNGGTDDTLTITVAGGNVTLDWRVTGDANTIGSPGFRNCATNADLNYAQAYTPAELPSA